MTKIKLSPSPNQENNSMQMKGLIFGILLFLGSLAVISTALADPNKGAIRFSSKFGNGGLLEKGHLIAVKRYIALTRTYEVYSVEFYGEGFSYVTPEGLAWAIQTLDIDRLKKKPNSIVGSQYLLDKVLPSLNDGEIAQRKKAH